MIYTVSPLSEPKALCEVDADWSLPLTDGSRWMYSFPPHQPHPSPTAHTNPFPPHHSHQPLPSSPLTSQPLPSPPLTSTPFLFFSLSNCLHLNKTFEQFQSTGVQTFAKSKTWLLLGVPCIRMCAYPLPRFLIYILQKPIHRIRSHACPPPPRLTNTWYQHALCPC